LVLGKSVNLPEKNLLFLSLEVLVIVSLGFFKHLDGVVDEGAEGAGGEED
jgi:hypothetical protein